MSPPSFADAGVPALPVTVRYGTEDRSRTEYVFFLELARQIEHEHPEHLTALGMTTEDYALSMSGPSLSIDESVAAGWMSAEEGRFIQGLATLDDLLELGHPPAEARAILLDQQARACASST
jgi:hypothetical protein